MKTIIISILLICIMILPINALSSTQEMDKKAKELKGINDYITVRNIDNYVNKEIKYKFYIRPRGLIKTWEEKKGDCSDRAMIKVYLLSRNNIKTRYVHGIVDYFYLHDWYQVRLNNKWQIPDTEKAQWKSMRKMGYGLW